MKISRHTAFSRGKMLKDFWNSFAWVIMALTIVGVMWEYRRLGNENIMLRAQLAFVEVKSPVQFDALELDNICSAWLMNTNILKARERICTGVVKQSIVKGKP